MSAMTKLTNPVKLLTDLGCDGQARGDVDPTLGHLTQVGTLAAQLHSSKSQRTDLLKDLASEPCSTEYHAVMDSTVQHDCLGGVHQRHKHVEIPQRAQLLWASLSYKASKLGELDDG